MFLKNYNKYLKMNRLPNQLDHILYDLNERINALMLSENSDGRIIEGFGKIVFQNLFFSKEISDLVITRAVHERSPSNKLKFLYVIDSLMKNWGYYFTPHLSPHIFRIFEEAYNYADEAQKLSLFKLHYTWKYIINENIYESINSWFNLLEMKKNLMKEKPEIIEKYDRYNEDVKERILSEAKMNQTVFYQGGVLNNNLSPCEPSSNLFPHSFNNVGFNPSSQIINKKSADPSPFNKYNNMSTFPQIQPLVTNQNKKNENFQLININKSEEIRLQSHHDDLFSGDSSSEKEVKQKPKKLINDKKHEVKPISDLGVELEKINKIKIKKIKLEKRTSEEIQPHFSDEEQENKYPSKNLKSTNNIYSNPQISLSNQINTGINLLNHNSNLPAQYPQNLNSLNLLNNLQQILSNFSQGNQMITNNLPNPHKEIGENYSTEKQNIKPQIQKEILVNKESSFPSVLKKLENLFTHDKILEKTPLFFSTLSKFFSDFESQRLIKIFSKVINQKLKDKTEILHYQNNQLFSDINKKSILNLSSDLKNLCAICGFRTKYSSKFIQHLDIHFNINFIKKHSDKKVLYRKEFDDKKTWVEAGINCNKKSCDGILKFSQDKDGSESNNLILTNMTHNINGYSFTLNSVLYYQNDSEHFTASKNIKPSEEIFKENEQTMIPVGAIDCYCVYCGEEFKKKYSNKFHFWFYINTVKFSRDEVESLNNGRVLDLQRSENNLIHEACIDDYVKMIKSGVGDKFISEKRMRTFT
jgi:hypothetical protein